jgi:hypothetical protein
MQLWLGTNKARDNSPHHQVNAHLQSLVTPGRPADSVVAVLKYLVSYAPTQSAGLADKQSHAQKGRWKLSSHLVNMP